MCILYCTCILKYFYSFSQINDVAFHTSVQTFPSVVVSDIDVVLRQHSAGYLCNYEQNYFIRKLSFLLWME